MNHDLILACWKRLGIMFNVKAADETADIERLLIETATALGSNSRLLPAVVSWLCKYHRLVCRHRLAKLAMGTDKHTLANLGFMLSCVKDNINSSHFNVVIKQCKKLQRPVPLFEIDRKNNSLTMLAESQSSDLAKEWGLWCEKIEVRDDIIRQADFIIKNNPGLKYRAFFGGQLKASILETIKHDPLSAESEVAFAKACGVTRKALREAVEHLEFCQLVKREYRAGKIKIRLSNSAAAGVQ